MPIDADSIFSARKNHPQVHSKSRRRCGEKSPASYRNHCHPYSCILLSFATHTTFYKFSSKLFSITQHNQPANQPTAHSDATRPSLVCCLLNVPAVSFLVYPSSSVRLRVCTVCMAPSTYVCGGCGETFAFADENSPLVVVVVPHFCLLSCLEPLDVPTRTIGYMEPDWHTAILAWHFIKNTSHSL